MATSKKNKSRRVLPGFGLSLGYTVIYLSLLVLIPLAMLFLKSTDLGWKGFWEAALNPRAVASYKLTFGAAFAAAAINGVFGLVVAWVLVRYQFPGRGLLDALVDLPFALPTAVGGIALVTAYAPNGWLGSPLQKLGIKAAFTPLGIIIALIFIGMPFVVRAVQPVLQEMEAEVEEAASTLGAGRSQVFCRIIFPHLLPALLTGVALAFARAVGEYGSVIFIAGNMPMKTEITSLLIVTKLEQFDYAGATALAVVMLIFSFLFLLLINALQRWSGRHHVA